MRVPATSRYDRAASSRAMPCRKQDETIRSCAAPMIRFVYAGYLAFALFLLYPMVQGAVTTSTACLRSALPGNGAVAAARPASDAHAHDCVLGSRGDAPTARLAAR
ncbi:hypothetical protein [Burkholderia multivorans]|uniref:hypothetical protein n=1 Tax=Burkholderia multivorans TaxID=87883 RepID=UPI001591A961|nr:hypothetical protein [Burkholderia multivorans]MBU9345347.1 hypothetical protein [Burkholderia multivorans]HEJ2439448.1 hypothetical protein [Burkholderia multivorans]HEM7814852.1 hypothetical protein [Burkholderia multivorans]HEM7818703.1 hypothetical protein [Burkholderia multivorans]HEM7824956.1 hypothetical protein [Burkholderia multivorans]